MLAFSGGLNEPMGLCDMRGIRLSLLGDHDSFEPSRSCPELSPMFQPLDEAADRVYRQSHEEVGFGNPRVAHSRFGILHMINGLRDSQGRILDKCQWSRCIKVAAIYAHVQCVAPLDTNRDRQQHATYRWQRSDPLMCQVGESRESTSAVQTLNPGGCESDLAAA